MRLGSRLTQQLYEKNPNTVKNYGIWLRYDSRSGTHNMYKEVRATKLNDAVRKIYAEMASRHRAREMSVQIIKTTVLKAAECIRPVIKQFHVRIRSLARPGGVGGECALDEHHATPFLFGFIISNLLRCQDQGCPCSSHQPSFQQEVQDHLQGSASLHFLLSHFTFGFIKVLISQCMFSGRSGDGRGCGQGMRAEAFHE